MSRVVGSHPAPQPAARPVGGDRRQGRSPWSAPFAVVLVLLGVQAIANGVYSPLTKPLLNQEITDSSRRAAILSVDSMARRAAIGIFAPIAGLYGEESVLELCGAIGIIGLILLAVAHMRRPALRGASAVAPE